MCSPKGYNGNHGLLILMKNVDLVFLTHNRNSHVNAFYFDPTAANY